MRTLKPSRSFWLYRFLAAAQVVFLLGVLDTGSSLWIASASSVSMKSLPGTRALPSPSRYVPSGMACTLMTPPST